MHRLLLLLCATAFANPQTEPKVPAAIVEAVYEGVAIDLVGPLDLTAAAKPIAAAGFVWRSDSWMILDAAGDETITALPIVKGREIFERKGPADALRLRFNVLRLSPKLVDRYVEVVERLSKVLKAKPTYVTRKGAPVKAGCPGVRADIATISAAWRAVGVQPGSPAAQKIVY